MYKRITIAILLLTMLIPAACSSSQSVKRSHWNIGSPRTVSETLVFEVDPTKNISVLRLEVDVNLKQGEATFVATNPRGDEVWSANTDKKLKIHETYDTIPGTWTLEITITEAQGSVETVWTGTK